MSTSRETILSNLRAGAVDKPPLPDLNGNWIQYPDRVARFKQSVELVGGQAEILGARPVASAISELLVVKNASRLCSLIPGIPGNVPLASVEDPHTLEDLDVTIVRGECGVAENGAVWITERDIRHRAALFIPQHLIIVVNAADLVDNMHQAYARITFVDLRFGVFISGPSKTADIEQSLVIGAHGPRSTTVFVEGART